MSDDSFSFYRVMKPDQAVEDPRREAEWPALLANFSPVTATIQEFVDLLVRAPKNNADAIRLEGVMIGLQIAESRQEVGDLQLVGGREVGQ